MSVGSGVVVDLQCEARVRTRDSTSSVKTAAVTQDAPITRSCRGTTGDSARDLGEEGTNGVLGHMVQEDSIEALPEPSEGRVVTAVERDLGACGRDRHNLQ